MRTTVQNTSRDARPSELDGALAAQAAGVGVWRWSPASGRLVLAGTAGALLRAEDVVNRRAFLARVHPDVRDLVDQALGHAARHGPLAIDFRLSPDVGAERWLRMRGQGGLDDREPTEMVGVLTDISEWKDAERSYGGLALAASSDDAIVAKAPEGIITDWNRGAELIFGYAAAEMIGKPINLLLPPGSRRRGRQYSQASQTRTSRWSPFSSGCRTHRGAASSATFACPGSTGCNCSSA
jgi:two-component system sensor kinase FixL